MLPIKTILHATDFSPRSECAFRLASALARDYEARLVVLHAVPPPVVMPMNGVVPADPEESKARVREKLEALHADDPKVAMEHRLVDGDPVHEILRAANETKADIIVMGTHGWTGLARLLMGSVAEGVVRKAPCPVLTLKTPMAAVKAAEKAPALEPAGV